MRSIQSAGPYADVVQARSPDDPSRIVNLGLRKETLRQYDSLLIGTVIAQYYGIIQDGMTLARHAFEGLQRPLMRSGNMKADQDVVVYTWRSLYDWEWIGNRIDGYPKRRTPTGGRVFAVLVIREETPNQHNVIGSIDRWNWAYEDPAFPHAPLAWEQRYKCMLWSRGEEEEDV